MDITQTAEVRATIQEMFEAMLAEESIVLTRNERRKLFEQIVAEILGYGPLEQFLSTSGITEIMVNGPKSVYVEQNGKLMRTNVIFEDNDHLLRIIDRIVAPLGRRIDEGIAYGRCASAGRFPCERGRSTDLFERGCFDDSYFL